MIIGLCGLARSGKDSFFNFIEDFKLNEKPNVRVAFADCLKQELDLFLRSSFGISAFTDDDKEKDVIRPILVAFGMQKRFVSDGIYWINKAEKEINRFKDEYNHFITDVRFPNEVLKIKELGGKCIHIEREGNSPPNLEEEENDPIIKSMSDFNFKWKDFSDSELDTAKDLARHFIKYKFNGRG